MNNLSKFILFFPKTISITNILILIKNNTNMTVSMAHSTNLTHITHWTMVRDFYALCNKTCTENNEGKYLAHANTNTHTNHIYKKDIKI